MILTPELTKVIEATDAVFETVDLQIPKPSDDWRRRLEALSEANLESHRSSLLFDMRCWQAEQMGFKKVTVSDLVKMIYNESHTVEEAAEGRQTYEWFYNHHDGVTLINDKCTWGGNPEQFARIEKKGLWYLPPFAKIEKWRCQFGKLNYLKREIPYGVVLRMNEIRKLNLFNVFNVLAPMEAWTRKTDIDPIVVATIFEVIKNEKGNDTAGQVSHFFLARWE